MDALHSVRAVFETHGGLPIPAVHIAGSKGKGTTAFLLAKIIELNGDRVGLFTSPAILSETEMIQVNGVPITQDRLDFLKEKIAKMDDSLSEFELQTLSAFEYFKEENCDLAVVECGWGGKNDASNVLEDKALTILTHIEMEHVDILGPTLHDIIHNKLGITRPGVPLLTPVNQIPEVFEILKEKGIEPVVVPQMELGTHHPESVGLAMMAGEMLGFSIDSVIEEALLQLKIPGRFEVMKFGPHTLLLDGAHTYDSVQYVLTRLPEFIQKNALPQPRFGIHFLKDKNPELPSLFPQDRTVWIPLHEERAGTCPPFLQILELPDLLENLRQKNTPEFWVLMGSFRLVKGVSALTFSPN